MNLQELNHSPDRLAELIKARWLKRKAVDDAKAKNPEPAAIAEPMAAAEPASIAPPTPIVQSQPVAVAAQEWHPVTGEVVAGGMGGWWIDLTEPASVEVHMAWSEGNEPQMLMSDVAGNWYAPSTVISQGHVSYAISEAGQWFIAFQSTADVAQAVQGNVLLPAGSVVHPIAA